MYCHFFSSCKKTTAQQTRSDGSAETLEPNTSYKPAFVGQTRIKAVKTKTPYKTEVLTKSLGRPWGIINLPDGRFLITEKQAI